MKFIFFIFFIFAPLSALEINTEEDIKKFILENPEVIIQSLQNYEKKKEEEKLKSRYNFINDNLSIIQKTDGFSFEGSENSKMIIVEFFDYNCGYCKKAHNEIKKLLGRNRNIKVVYKNLPILSERSAFLAKLSLAVGLESQNDFSKFHDFIYNSSKKINIEKINDYLESIGLDSKKIMQISESDEINSMIQNNVYLAENIGITGTPAFLIGNELISGFVSSKIIESLILN